MPSSRWPLHTEPADRPENIQAMCLPDKTAAFSLKLLVLHTYYQMVKMISAAMSHTTNSTLPMTILALPHTTKTTTKTSYTSHLHRGRCSALTPLPSTKAPLAPGPIQTHRARMFAVLSNGTTEALLSGGHHQYISIRLAHTKCHGPALSDIYAYTMS